MDYGIKAIGQKISRAYQWKQIFENDLIKNKGNEKPETTTNPTK